MHLQLCYIRLRTLIFIAVISLSTTLFVSSQSPIWKLEHLGIEAGLSNRFVNSFVQDARGFMWIGTNFGLNRYDGHRIDILTRESNQLLTNEIQELFLDDRQMIWIIHREVAISRILGIDIMDPISFEITKLEDYLPEDFDLAQNEIVHIDADHNNIIYFLTSNDEMFKYQNSKIYRVLKRSSSMKVDDFAADEYGIFIHTNDFQLIEKWTLSGELLGTYPVPFMPDDSTSKVFWRYLGSTNNNQTLYCFIKDNWIDGFAILNEDGSFTSLPFPFPKASLILGSWDDADKTAWCFHDNRIISFNPLDMSISYTHPFVDSYQSFIYTGNHNIIWIGTENGVYSLTSKPAVFKSYLQSDTTMHSCRGFAQDSNGSIYIMTVTGNYVLHPKDTVARLGFKTSRSYGNAIISDFQNNIWLAGEYPHIIKINPQTQKTTYWHASSSRYFATWALHISSGDILMGTTEGLYIKNLANNDLPARYTKLNGYDQLKSSTIFHFLEGEDGIWMCTNNGLFLLDKVTGVQSHFNEKNSGLTNNNLLYLHIDRDDIFWIATRGGGMIRWDRKNNTSKTYTIHEGLSHNVIYAIFEDDFGYLWMTSDYGLMRFEKETGNCMTYLPADGIPHEEFNRASYFKDKKGNFYFGGLNGFITFHPKDIRRANEVSYPLMLAKFEVLNDKTGKSEDWTSKVGPLAEIILNPQQNSFIIHYAILDFKDPKLKHYAYQIEGLNNNWIYLSDDFIRFNGLGGGKYRIRIKGQSANGIWSENEIVIPLRILKPFFARTGTLIIFTLFVISLSLFLYRRRIAQHKAKLEREREITSQLRHVDKIKDQFLANTSHELRTPLNGIVGLSESLLEKNPSKADREDLELIIASGRRLSNLVNDILDFSRLKEHDLQLQKKPVDIRAMAEHCLRMNKHAIKNKNISLRNQIQENLPYCLADENRLQQILQNLVANSIKFTEAGFISIDARADDEMIFISITDTGIGIEKGKQEIIFNEFEQADGSIAREFGGSGLGLSITKYLVELHGGSISVISEPGKGSTFTITIPVFKGEVSKITKDSFIIPKLENESAPHTNGNFSNLISATDTSKRHILIVDDEPVNLKVLKNHLEQAGYRVTMANDGQEALQLLESGEKYNLVLLDVMMPRIPGYEVCQKIRERYMLSELPVIMVTSKNQVSDLVEGISVGANDYINKPFLKDELLSRVKIQLQTFDIYEATGRFVPHEFIQSLGRHGITDLKLGDMVERNVHVMFSDIRDYTTLAEDMSPRENFDFVNTLAGKVGPLVKKNHGIINQYLGDTIMMLFLHRADDGIQAAIDILRMVDDYNKIRKTQNRRPIRLGMGIHSGPLMMGIIGDIGRTEAAVISDTVNTASRMEGLTKHFHVNFILSEETVQKLENKDTFNLRYLGKVQAKGKFHPIGVYECFDGDSPEQVELKNKTSYQFHEAMEAYYERNMLLALRHFEAVYQANPADRTSFGFLHRVHGHLEQGLSAEWNGVETMHFK